MKQHNKSKSKKINGNKNKGGDLGNVQENQEVKKEEEPEEPKTQEVREPEKTEVTEEEPCKQKGMTDMIFGNKNPCPEPESVSKKTFSIINPSTWFGGKRRSKKTKKGKSDKSKKNDLKKTKKEKMEMIGGKKRNRKTVYAKESTKGGNIVNFAADAKIANARMYDASVPMKTL